jgi:Fur family transcriptional regulator, iron response regulator
MTTHIEDLLNQHGVKPTPQRAVITEFLLSTCAHPTADEIFQAVSDKLPVSLSRATVYNTLNCLVDAGVIKEVVTEPGKSRYDANVTDHHHFVDVKTGKVFDIEPDQISKLQLNLGAKFKVQNFHVTIFGEVQEAQ